MDHVPFMHRCLALADRGRGNVSINPLVGSVLVRDGLIIAEGFHSGFGKAHAERQLLVKFEQNIRSTDTLYVNLEPCCHSGKKTPPCTDILLERGVRRVVYGMQDPNPLVAGKGIELLRKAGVEVSGPVERASCEWLNRGFISLQTKGRPWVTLKSARTSSGAIAKSDGSPLKITSEEQDRWSHQWLRARHDAILVGVGTVIADDPQLTVRLSDLTNKKIEQNYQQPLRIILDPHLRIPMTAKAVNGLLFDSAHHRLVIGTLVIVSPQADASKVSELEKRGVRVWEVPIDQSGFDLPSLWKVLMTPSGDYFGISSLLVEGGAKTWEMFRKAGVVDYEISLVGSG
ncbi:MAG: bifunctional diaminohydroxyphosphoribosylaminopyrimidine deaminase/5-amino-6-(5-phosphoribosylamino)uracil reductase RibD [Candidatus Peregrinibacteria bacterium]